MTETNSLDVIRKAYDCYRHNDIPGVLALVDEGCDWRVPGPTQIVPWAGSYQGRGEIQMFFDQLASNLECLAFEPKEYLAKDDTIVVLGHERQLVKTTGKTYDVDWAHRFEVRDGKIVRFMDYQDTATIEEAMH